MREVIVLSAGGTIASVDGGTGATPRLEAGDLLGDAPVAGIAMRSVRTLPGPQLTLADALDIARAACSETRAGRGVVVTSGTDTLEELAVLCDATCGDGPPVVLTGAIRPASAPGADGPANLLDAVAAAGEPATEGLGALVCFAGELHAARAVRKADSTGPCAFASPRTGPVGRVVERRVQITARPPRCPALGPERLDFAVPIVPTWLGDDGGLLRAALGLEPDALVLVALGGGHVPPPVLSALREAPRALPVAACVRPECGAFLRATYGFEGAERDVLAAGVIPAGQLSPPAARMLLLVALGAGAGREAMDRILTVGA